MILVVGKLKRMIRERMSFIIEILLSNFGTRPAILVMSSSFTSTQVLYYHLFYRLRKTEDHDRDHIGIRTPDAKTDEISLCILSGVPRVPSILHLIYNEIR